MEGVDFSNTNFMTVDVSMKVLPSFNSFILFYFFWKLSSIYIKILFNCFSLVL